MKKKHNETGIEECAKLMTALNDVFLYEGDLDLSGEIGTQLRDPSFDIGGPCSICGKDKSNELGMSIDNLRDVCGDCYAKGIAWAITMAANENKEKKKNKRARIDGRITCDE